MYQPSAEISFLQKNCDIKYLVASVEVFTTSTFRIFDSATNTCTHYIINKE